jgi:hypothetical protein
MEQRMDNSGRRVVLRELCSACRVLLDEETAFRITRANRSYCCRCYLRHDVTGAPFPARAQPAGGYRFSLPLAERE